MELAFKTIKLFIPYKPSQLCELGKQIYINKIPNEYGFFYTSLIYRTVWPPPRLTSHLAFIQPFSPAILGLYLPWNFPFIVSCQLLTKSHGAPGSSLNSLKPQHHRH